MKKIFKFVAAVAAALAMALVPALSGCTQISYSTGGTVSIRDIYEEVKAETGNDDLTFLEFIEEYLGYSGSDIEELGSLKSSINNSMLSAVSVLAEFRVSAQPPFAGSSTASSVGSGVIIDIDKEAGDMYIVTNAHVVYYSGALNSSYSDNVSVYLYGYEYQLSYDEGEAYIVEGDPIPARVIGASLTWDIAVLKVENSELVRESYAVAAEWTDEEEIDLGEPVYTIGNPLDESLGVSTGVVSRQSQDILIDMYDTDDTSDDFTYRVMRLDISINGGNSGGGLFDYNGKLVGIVNAKTVADSEGYYTVEGMAYAIPASSARRAAENLIYSYEQSDSGLLPVELSRPVIGVSVIAGGTVPAVDDLGNVSVEELVVVSSLQSNSIFSGQLKKDDILTAISLYDNGTLVDSAKIVRTEKISEMLLAARAGYTLAFTVLRADSSAESGMAEFTVSAEITQSIFRTVD